VIQSARYQCVRWCRPDGYIWQLPFAQGMARAISPRWRLAPPGLMRPVDHPSVTSAPLISGRWSAPAAVSDPARVIAAVGGRHTAALSHSCHGLSEPAPDPGVHLGRLRSPGLRRLDGSGLVGLAGWPAWQSTCVMCCPWSAPDAGGAARRSLSPVEHGRYLAQHIPGRMWSWNGDERIPSAALAPQLLAQVMPFLQEASRGRPPSRTKCWRRSCFRHRRLDDAGGRIRRRTLAGAG
jgi:hypothetical protein